VQADLALEFKQVDWHADGAIRVPRQGGKARRDVVSNDKKSVLVRKLGP
jgi:hypothetical protein